MRRATRLKLLLSAFGLVGVLLLPATATGAKQVRTLKGGIAGDANSFVSLKVVLKNGKAKKVKGLIYKNLDTYCDPDGSVGPEDPAYVGEVSGSGGKNRGPSVEVDRSFYWVSYPEDPPRMIEMSGKLKSKAKKAVGTMAVYHNEIGRCETAKGKFVLSK